MSLNSYRSPNLTVSRGMEVWGGCQGEARRRCFVLGRVEWGRIGLEGKGSAVHKTFQPYVELPGFGALWSSIACVNSRSTTQRRLGFIQGMGKYSSEKTSSLLLSCKWMQNRPYNLAVPAVLGLGCSCILEYKDSCILLQ